MSGDRKQPGAPVSAIRQPSVRVKTARGRKISSTRWLQRQLNDPYVAAAQRHGYRSRSAFKLLELDERRRFLRPGQTVVDLGCAPGGWLQAARERIGARGCLIGVDLSPTLPVAAAMILSGDFTTVETQAALRAALNGATVDVVLSDMAAATIGHPATDHLRIIALVEEAAAFAATVLRPGGVLVAKVFAGGTEHTLLRTLKRDYARVGHDKPPASRQESAETYLIATGFRGTATAGEEEGS